jgi:hypothetical protein
MDNINYIYEFLKYGKGLRGKVNEVTEDWRKWLKEKFRDCSLSILGVVKSRRMRWAGNVARMVNRRGAYRVLVGGTLGEETTWKT